LVGRRGWKAWTKSVPVANVAHQSAVRTDFEAVSSVLLDWDGPFHPPL
jgi:hypothetical protein